MKHITTTLLLALGTATLSHAATVVSYLATNEDPQNTYLFNSSQNLTPQVTTDPDRGTIFVAYQEVNGANAGIQTFGGAGLRVRNGTPAIGEAGTALFAFDLGGTFEFGADTLDDFTIRTSGNTLRIDTGTSTRLSLQNAGSWYVSETIHVTGNTSGDALSLDWFNVPNITTTGLNNINGTVVDPATFNSITMMGTYVHLESMADTGGNSSSNYGVQSLTINAVAVPEPSSAALLGLGGLALILRRRKG